MNTVEILKAARELISDEKRWTKNANARSISGEEVGALNENAYCFCSIGALHKVAPEDSLRSAAVNVLRFECGGSVSNFNDNHSHEAVLSLFDRAIARAEGGAA